MKKELSFYQKAILICFSILIFFSSGEICVRMIRYGEKYAKKDNFFDYPVTYNFFRKRTLPNGEKILSGYREGVELKEFSEKKNDND